MERYKAIKRLAVLSAELIEQVQFEDHQGRAEKIEPLLAQIITLALAASEDPEALKTNLSQTKIKKKEKNKKKSLFFGFLDRQNQIFSEYCK